MPLLLPYALSSTRVVIELDARRWAEVLRRPIRHLPWLLLTLLAEYPSFRSLFYYRLSRGGLAAHLIGGLLQPLCRPLSSLLVSARGDIGPGLVIQHGFGTVLAAESIGANCFVNQGVTIGYRGLEDCPVLGDRVVVTAGAKVLGAIHIGDDVVIGANAVVLADVPAGCVVAGVPARIIRRDGRRVDEPLSPEGATSREA